MNGMAEINGLALLYPTAAFNGGKNEDEYKNKSGKAEENKERK